MGGDQIAERALAVLRAPTSLSRPERPTPTSDSRSLLEELRLAALHGWQRVAESRGRGRGAVDVAVLFTDLVGFSEWALESHAVDAGVVAASRRSFSAMGVPKGLGAHAVERRAELPVLS
jgi:class 3 adenylate cyclase